jgi:hypothetical protein
MKMRIWLAACSVLAAAACTEVQTTPTGPDEGLLAQVPEGVLAIAAANQNLAAVKVDPADGCYTYRYEGPVETTFLPLRTDDGRPICSRALAETPTVAG